MTNVIIAIKLTSVDIVIDPLYSLEKCGIVNREMSSILVTGASGNVGREVVKALVQANISVRATLYRSGEDERYSSSAVEYVPFDFGDSRTFPAAFNEVSSLFLMRPPPIADVERYIQPLIEYAAGIGVRHIVFLSLLGAGKNTFVPHARVEALIRSSGVDYTFLRCGFFMQNLDTIHREDVVEHDDLFIPAGLGKTAFIDTRDIGEVAARILTESGHENKAYILTGDEALTYDEVAAIMTEVLGRKITYSNPSLLAFARRMRSRGHPWGYIGVMAGIYLSTRRGRSAEVSPAAGELLGRPPTTLREYVSDYAAAWSKSQTIG